MTRLLACLLVSAALLAAPLHAQQPAPSAGLAPLDRIAAVVNEDVILQSELDRAIGNITAQYAKNPEKLPPRDVLERQVLERLIMVRLEVARAGDVLTVWRLDRLGRSLHDLILLGRKLDEMGIGLMSVQEKIDTSSSGGRLVFHMFGALAEFERNLVRERTQAGLNAARARGRKGGRPKVLDPAKRQLVAKLYAEKQHTIGEICRMMGISKPTLYNYIAEANA